MEAKKTKYEWPSTSSGSSGSESMSNDDLFHPTDNPLEKEVIIREIRKYLPYKYLLVVRQINKKWAEEITSKLKARIKNADNFLDFVLTLEDDLQIFSVNQKIMNVDLSEWELKKKEARIIGAIFNRLSKSLFVKEIKVPEFNLQAWPMVITRLSSSLEILNADLELTKDITTRIFEDDDNDDDEEPIVLKKIKKVKLTFTCNVPKDKFNQNFLKDFFKVCCRTIELELEIKGGLHSETQTVFVLKELSKNTKMPNLKKLILICQSSEQVLKKLVKFSLRLTEEIQINFNNSELPSKCIPGIFSTITGEEYKAEYPKLYLKTKYLLKEKEYRQVKKIDSSGFFSRLTLDKLLKMFPELEELDFCDAGRAENSLKSVSSWDHPKITEFMKEFSYHFGEGHSLRRVNIIKNITDLFPNLTKLELKSATISYNKRIKLNSIFRKLDKLEILHLDFPKLIMNDEMIVGLCSKTKNNFPDKSYEFFMKMGKIWNQGVCELKELRDLHIKIRRGLSEISFVMGFGILPKLETFNFDTQSSDNFSSDFFKIFIDGFEKLETLSYNQQFKQDDIKVLKGKRPFLKIVHL